MAKKQPTLLTDDPRYPAFVARYAGDLTRFAIEVVGMQPTHQQIDLLDPVSLPGSRVTVRSGHGSGKSRSLAVISLWHLLCYYNSNLLLTAPKIEQVRSVAFKEIADCLAAIERSEAWGWLAPHVVLMAEKVWIAGYKSGWFIVAKTAPRGNPESLAGMHRDWYMIIADEASGIPDPNFAVLTGALTDSRNRMLLLSQPTRPSGFFYDTHHSLSTRQGGVWHAIRMDSRDSPLVSPSFIREKLDEYTEEEYQIKVCGEFPSHRDGYLMGREAAEKCINRVVIDPAVDEYGVMVLCDVGAGEYRDKSVAVVALVSGHGSYGEIARRVQVIDVPIMSNTRDLQDFSRGVFRLQADLESPSVLVDAGGMGVAVVQSLESHGIDVQRVKWGSPCFRKSNRERFINLRAQAMVDASKAAAQGRLGIADGRWRRDLLDQMSRVPFSFDERARYAIAKKDDMRRQGLPSPDLWDAICFAFLEGATYHLAEGIGGRGTAAAGALRSAESIFSEL